MRIRICVVALAAIAALLASALPASAAVTKASVDPAERHCVAYLVDEEPARTAERATAPSELCFATESEVDAYLGNGVQRSSSNTIGRHYTSTGYSGSSITIVGTTCGGGVWYATGSWNNNIESTRNFCGSAGTRFYDSSSCSGSNILATSDKWSLGWMNNRTSCVRYG